MLKTVEGFNLKWGLTYQVSDTGEIFDPYKRRRNVHVNPKTGYVQVRLQRNGKPCSAYLHRIVATAFVPNPENKPEVNHKDGNKLNNHASNLEWCTHRENVQHAYQSHLYSDRLRPVQAIRTNGVPLYVFEDVNAAAHFFGITPGAIRRVLYGKGKCQGYTWRFI